MRGIARMVETTAKAGTRETQRLPASTAELARQAANGKSSDAHLVTGRTGRPLSPVAARELLLRLARTAAVSVRSVHELRAERRRVAAA